MPEKKRGGHGRKPAKKKSNCSAVPTTMTRGHVLSEFQVDIRKLPREKEVGRPAQAGLQFLG